jgi:hypothetical protein
MTGEHVEPALPGFFGLGLVLTQHQANAHVAVRERKTERPCCVL